MYYSGTKSFQPKRLVAHRHLASFRCSDMLRVRQRCRFLAIQLRSRELTMNQSYDPRRNTTYSGDLFRFHILETAAVRHDAKFEAADNDVASM